MMPKSINYDADTETLHVGEGQIRPVPPRVWEYEVSGMKIVRKWFDYRKENPNGRRSSPLDSVGPNRWPSRFTTELLDLLNVLCRCVELEPAQEAILDRICQRPVIAITDLTQAKVLPVKDSTRRPVSPDEQPTLGRNSRVAPIPAFKYVESGELDRYIREFAAGTLELDDALSSGRLPFPPSLAERSPDLAGLAAGIWRLTSIDSPEYRRLFEADKGFHDESLTRSVLPAGIEEQSGAPTTSESPPPAQRRRSHAQTEGARLEQGMLGVFERLFRIEAGNWQAETGNTRMPRAQVRRQRSGTQNGADIVLRFKGAAIDASSTCLVECKNFTANPSGLTVGTVADKVLQAEARFEAEPVDHSEASGHRFLYLTKDCELGWISVRVGSSLKFSVIPLPRVLRWPEDIYLLREDIVLVAARSEILIVDISDGTATEVAYFRVSGDLRVAAVIDHKLLGLIFEPEYAESEALLIDIESGLVRWRISVPPGERPCGWFRHGIVMASDSQLLLFREDGDVEIRHPGLEPSPAAICVQDDQAILVSEYGQEIWLPLDNSGDPESTLAIHSGAGVAVTATGGQVLSSGTDGSVVLTRRDAKGALAVVARDERRLRCDGALIEGMNSDRELAIFTANGAH